MFQTTNQMIDPFWDSHTHGIVIGVNRDLSIVTVGTMPNIISGCDLKRPQRVQNPASVNDLLIALDNLGHNCGAW